MGEVIVADGEFSGSAERRAALAAVARGARLHRTHAGQTLRIAGLELQVLAPEPGAPAPGQLAMRVVRPGGRSFCDLADLDPDDQAVAAGRLSGGCDYLLLPDAGRSAPSPALLAASRPARFVVSDSGGKLARDLPRGDLVRTSEEGTLVLAL
jgi:hypothetical protein